MSILVLICAVLTLTVLLLIIGQFVTVREIIEEIRIRNALKMTIQQEHIFRLHQGLLTHASLILVVQIQNVEQEMEKRCAGMTVIFICRLMYNRN